MENCLTCSGASVCDQCKPGYAFDSVSIRCELSFKRMDFKVTQNFEPEVNGINRAVLDFEMSYPDGTLFTTARWEDILNYRENFLTFEGLTLNEDYKVESGKNPIIRVSFMKIPSEENTYELTITPNPGYLMPYSPGRRILQTENPSFNFNLILNEELSEEEMASAASTGAAISSVGSAAGGSAEALTLVGSILSFD